MAIEKFPAPTPIPPPTWIKICTKSQVIHMQMNLTKAHGYSGITYKRLTISHLLVTPSGKPKRSITGWLNFSFPLRNQYQLSNLHQLIYLKYWRSEPSWPSWFRRSDVVQWLNWEGNIFLHITAVGIQKPHFGNEIILCEAENTDNSLFGLLDWRHSQKIHFSLLCYIFLEYDLHYLFIFG